jgi:hypothetical protein
MPAVGYNFKIELGVDFLLHILIHDVDGTILDLTPYTFFMGVKVRKEDPAYILDSNNNIVITSGGIDGTLDISIDDLDTVGLSRGWAYYELTMSDSGFVTRLLEGRTGLNIDVPLLGIAQSSSIMLVLQSDGSIALYNAGEEMLLSNYLTGIPITFTVGDTTPSIVNGYTFLVPAAVTIVDFDDPPTSGTKLIEVVAGADNVVIAHDSTKIKLNGGLDVSLNAGDALQFRYVDTVWVERLRNLL